MSQRIASTVAAGWAWLVLSSCSTDARNVSVGAAEVRPGESVVRDDAGATATPGPGPGSAPAAGPSAAAPTTPPDAGTMPVAAAPEVANAPPPAAAAEVVSCGDGVLATNEACDDGNQLAGDGCAADCLQVAPGYFCEPARACVQFQVCGDSLLQPGETCDDGNTVGGDGCAPSCRVERAYICPDVGLNCIPSDRCGDGLLTPREQCDDSNRTAGDGCTATCQIEQGWYCPGLGPLACEPVCGDGAALGRETCDDGGIQSGDGCSFLCTVEASPDLIVICGDALLGPGELCDDGNSNGSGYGFCASNCDLGPRCGDGEVNAGLESCDTINNNSAYHNNPEACAPGCVRPWYCGDGIVDGMYGEACDDGVNDGAYGGCTAQCLLAPRCGDGQVTAPESCDDGNLGNGDGCNLLCRIETAMSRAPMLR